MLADVGVSATRMFPHDDLMTLLGTEARFRDVVVIDSRGTGDSDVLRCPGLQRAFPLGDGHGLGNATADCAARLGPARSFYTTRDAVEDVEAVRAALGAERIALFAQASGSGVALGYARRYPGRVERLVLDGAAASAPDPLYRASFQAAPRVLRAFCRGGICRRVTSDPGRDLARLAARLRRRPAHGRSFDERGRPHRQALGPFDLFEAVVVGDVSDDLRGAIPAAVRAALRGDLAPILRSARAAHDVGGELGAAGPDPRLASIAALTAGTCEEADLPWARSASLADRRAQAAQAVRQLGRRAFGPFGPQAALASDVLRLCERWPAAPLPPDLGSAPVPAVPTLLLTGDEGLIAPLESVRALAARIPDSRLIVVPGATHQVLAEAAYDQGFGLEEEPASCALKAFRSFLAVRPLPRCGGRYESFKSARALFPRSLREVRPIGGVGGRAGRTLAAIRLTLGDLSDLTIDNTFDAIETGATVRAGGLRGGAATITTEPDRLRLRRLTFVPGVRVSGTLSRFAGLGGSLRGRLRVSGPAAARGTLTVRGRTVTGHLGGRRVRARMALDQDSLTS
jgi:pimeloyl-ACP methyl ester carboxylesterase